MTPDCNKKTQKMPVKEEMCRLFSGLLKKIEIYSDEEADEAKS
jgi:hypothetical protein